MSVFLGESSSCGDLALKVRGQQQQGRTGNQGEWVITDQANAATITLQHPLCFNEIIISVLSDAGQTFLRTREESSTAAEKKKTLKRSSAEIA